MILSYHFIHFSFPKLILLLSTIGRKKIVFHNLEESCYVVKERTDSIRSLSIILSRYPPSGKHVWGAYWNESGWAGILRVWHTRKGKAPGRIGTLYAGFTHSIHVSENTLGAQKKNKFKNTEKSRPYILGPSSRFSEGPSYICLAIANNVQR